MVETCAANADDQILFTYCRHEDEAQALVGRFQNVEAVQVDFCDEDSVDRFVERLENETVDVLINNAYAGSAQGTHFYKTVETGRKLVAKGHVQIGLLPH